MAGGALVDLAVDPQVGSRRTLAPPLLLAVGWLGLFAYCAAYLTEDMLFRRPAPSMVVAVPEKYLSTNAEVSPTASKIWAPQ